MVVVSECLFSTNEGLFFVVELTVESQKSWINLSFSGYNDKKKCGKVFHCSFKRKMRNNEQNHSRL